MTAAPLTQLIDIQTFGSIEEIRALDNFVEHNPFSTADYKLSSLSSKPTISCCCVSSLM